MRARACGVCACVCACACMRRVCVCVRARACGVCACVCACACMRRVCVCVRARACGVCACVRVRVRVAITTLQVAWAPGLGIKGDSMKIFWNVQLGVSYIPWEKITAGELSLSALSAGCAIDPSSLPPGMTLEDMQPLQKSSDSDVQMEKSPPASSVAGTTDYCTVKCCMQ